MLRINPTVRQERAAYLSSLLVLVFRVVAASFRPANPPARKARQLDLGQPSQAAAL